MTDFIKLKPVGSKAFVYVNPEHFVCFGKSEDTAYTTIILTGDDRFKVEEDPGYILNLVRQFTNK